MRKRMKVNIVVNFNINTSALLQAQQNLAEQIEILEDVRVWLHFIVCLFPQFCCPFVPMYSGRQTRLLVLWKYPCF